MLWNFFLLLIGNAGVVSQVDLIRDYGKLLTEGEAIDLGFKLIRDTFIFTNKRLILVDKQGLTGSKTAYLSINYKQISRFSAETTGTFDLEAELKIWISIETVRSITKKFNKSTNVYDVQKVLVHHVLKYFYKYDTFPKQTTSLFFPFHIFFTACFYSGE